MPARGAIRRKIHGPPTAVAAGTSGPTYLKEGRVGSLGEAARRLVSLRARRPHAGVVRLSVVAVFASASFAMSTLSVSVCTADLLRSCRRWMWRCWWRRWC